MQINPKAPSMQGLDTLANEFTNRVFLPVKREELDWKEVLYTKFGWSPENPANGKVHLGQVSVLNAAFQEKKKVIFIRAGKRSGKTQVATAVGRTILTEVPNARGWCASGSYDLSDRILDTLWNDAAVGKFGKVAERNRNERRIRFEGGGLLQGKSWAEPESLEGESLDFCLADEAQTLDEERFNRLYARTLDRGGILICIGSAMSDDDWFLAKCEWAKMTTDCVYFEWTVEDNPYQDEEELDRAREILDEESYAELFLNQVRMPEGLVFSGYFDPTYSVFEDEPDPNLPMQAWVDPGTRASAYACVLAQVNEKDEIHLYDEVYEHGLESDTVVEIARNNDYWHLVTLIVMDVAGRQHHDTKYSPKEIWQKKTNLSVYDRKVAIDGGIEVHKSFLLNKTTGKRKLFIHSRMKNTLREYKSYKYPKRGLNSSAAKSPIDAFNHSMKAISYGIVHNFGYFAEKKKKSIRSWFIN